MQSDTKPKAPVTVALVGAGHRAILYGSYALQHPERMKVVAVAEPNALRRAEAARQHDIPPERQFCSYQELAGRPPLADAAINATMDRLHYDSSIALLQSGYHLLLEKPIAATAQHVRHLIDCARQCQKVVMVCHVLRYAPFYQTIKRMLEEGQIGRVIALHTSENVSYHHMAVGFVRGRWNKEADSNPMLLAKCCHDLDIIAWMLSGQNVVKVASFGSLMQFRPENAPPGSALRCLEGCQIEGNCAYSARLNYITHDLWGFYAWEPIEHLANPTTQQKLFSLQQDNPFGRCVWHCDNDVVDHQTVIMQFAGGATATHNMLCATARATRTIHVVGSGGEIEGDLEGGWIRLRRPSLVAGQTYIEEKVTTDSGPEGLVGHGGGDLRLVEDFTSVLRGEPTSRGVTRIEDSWTGHSIAFAAEQSRRNGNVVKLNGDIP
jgi:predicted dehydrogenase